LLFDVRYYKKSPLEVSRGDFFVYTIVMLSSGKQTSVVQKQLPQAFNEVFFPPLILAASVEFNFEMVFLSNFNLLEAFFFIVFLFRIIREY
jgi:ABC-type anion transport system duplicated permease subunit